MTRRRMIVWEGPSQLDGAPVMAVATYDTREDHSSDNTKTGAMVQIYILRSDIAPLDVLARGLDASICGDCPHRSPASGGSGACYVQVAKAPRSTWEAIQRDGTRVTKSGKPTKVGDSIPFDVEEFRGKQVRFGAYGDPAAVPVEVWQQIHSVARAGVTGYTHQWDKSDPAFAEFCMASVDDPSDIMRAHKRGYRLFIVRPEGSPKPRGAVTCPASAEAGKRTTCSACMQCGGTGNGRRADITILAHGATAKRFQLSVV